MEPLKCGHCWDQWRVSFNDIHVWGDIHMLRVIVEVYKSFSTSSREEGMDTFEMAPMSVSVHLQGTHDGEGHRCFRKQV